MRQWRVGTISMGLLFIVLGVLLLGNSVWNLSIVKLIEYGWPFILILLGAEVIFFALFKKDSHLKFDFFSVFILILAVSFTFLFYSHQAYNDGNNGKGFFYSIGSILSNIGSEADYDFDINRTLDIPDHVDEILIDVTNGDLHITGEDTKTATVKGTISLDAPNEALGKERLEKVFTLKINGNQAIISVKKEKNLNLLGGDALKAKLTISVPKDRFINAELINGDILTKSFEKSGNIETVNGEIRFQDGKGNFTLETVNGELDIQDIIGEVSISSVNGKMNIRNVSGKVTAETTNGEIDIESDQLAGDWEAETLNGEISVTIPKDADANILAKVSIGEVDGNIPWKSKKSDEGFNLGDEKEATLGSGKYTIKLTSKHGEINVKQN